MLAVCFCAASVLHAQFQMPDPKQMSGIPRPVDDLPDGSVSVRLIRGQLTNNIADHVVELHVGGNVLKAATDEGGRAQFDKLAAGASVKASVDIDGEHLESEEFPAPGRGGIRLMLVATDKSKAASNPGLAPISSRTRWSCRQVATRMRSILIQFLRKWPARVQSTLPTLCFVVTGTNMAAIRALWRWYFGVWTTSRRKAKAWLKRCGCLACARFVMR